GYGGNPGGPKLMHGHGRLVRPAGAVHGKDTERDRGEEAAGSQHAKAMIHFSPYSVESIEPSRAEAAAEEAGEVLYRSSGAHACAARSTGQDLTGRRVE